MMRRPTTKRVRRCTGADDLYQWHPRRAVGVAQPEIPSRSPESHLRVASMAHKRISGVGVGGGRDEHTIVNHRCSMHAVIAVDVDIS